MNAQVLAGAQRPSGPVSSAGAPLGPEAAYARLERACADLQAPFALVDLDAMWANAADMERRAAGKPIRLASKSVRCRALQERVLARPGFAGTLAFTLPEALWLASRGAGDILVAYPSADKDALGKMELTSSGNELMAIWNQLDRGAVKEDQAFEQADQAVRKRNAALDKEM